MPQLVPIKTSTAVLLSTVLFAGHYVDNESGFKFKKWSATRRSGLSINLLYSANYPWSDDDGVPYKMFHVCDLGYLYLGKYSLAIRRNRKKKKSWKPGFEM